MQEPNHGRRVARKSMPGDEASTQNVNVPQGPLGARQLINQGAELFKAGDFEAAEEKFKLAIAADPRSDVAYANIGNIYFRRKKYAEALVWLDKAMALNPNARGVPECIGECNVALAIGPAKSGATGDKRAGKTPHGEAAKKRPWWQFWK